MKHRFQAAASLSMLALSSVAAAGASDSVETQSRGFPWIAHSSVEAFRLETPASPGSQPYQISLYQAFTIQSLPFAWFHLGLRSRETMVAGLSKPFRDPASLRLMGTAEVVRDFAFVYLAGNVPLADEPVPAGDSGALYRGMTEYSPLPHPNFLAPRGLHAGIFGRHRFTTWETMAGISYARSALYDGLGGPEFYPAAYFDFFIRGVLEGEDWRDRFDIRATLYGEEGNRNRDPAHREGSLWQVRYGHLGFARRISWQLGGGAAYKLPDANRKLKLAGELPDAGSNYNLQRLYGEFALTFAPRTWWLMRLFVLPKLLAREEGWEVGHETEGGAALAFRLWGAHRLRVSGSTIYGEFLGKQYLGFGMRAEFAFRHLGFQDVAEEGEE